jgi:uncharacterized protein
VQIAILSDTHMPRGARCLPAACVQRLEAADLIIHAGDFTSLAILRELETYAGVIAVHGNVDAAELRAALPQRATVDASGASLGLVHDAGPARRRIERLHAWFPECDAVVFGHSHIPLHEQAADSFQIFNPGSPTERRRAPRHTMGVARVTPANGRSRNGNLTFELVALD